METGLSHCFHGAYVLGEVGEAKTKEGYESTGREIKNSNASILSGDFESNHKKKKLIKSSS